METVFEDTMGKGKGWSKEEHHLSMKAFVTASQDFNRRNGQKANDVKARILKYFKVLLSKNGHKDGSIQIWVTLETPCSCFTKELKNCVEFDGHVQRVVAAKPTGEPTASDILNAALASYNGSMKVDGGPHRAFYHYLGDDGCDAGKDFSYMN